MRSSIMVRANWALNGRSKDDVKIRIDQKGQISFWEKLLFLVIAGMFAITGWIFTHFHALDTGQLLVAVLGMIAAGITVFDSFRRIRRP